MAEDNPSSCRNDQTAAQPLLPLDGPITADCAQEIGYAVSCFGNFQESLAHLFSAVLFNGMSEVALAAWHSHQNDRAQREMLRAAASVALATRPELIEEIVWLLNQANSVADTRNNVIHASYATLKDGIALTTIADDYYGNERSKRLAGRDLVFEFRNFRARVDALNGFASALFQCVIDSERALPDRPARSRSAEGK